MHWLKCCEAYDRPCALRIQACITNCLKNGILSNLAAPAIWAEETY
jgi:hypothetical protein